MISVNHITSFQRFFGFIPQSARRESENTGIQQSHVTFCPPAGSSYAGISLVPSSSQYSQARAASAMSTDSVRSDLSTRTLSKTKPMDDDVEEELTRQESVPGEGEGSAGVLV